MAKNPKKCSEETMILILKDYVENVVFKKIKYTDLTKYANENGYESVERRDFSRNAKIREMINELNEKNLLSEKALKLEQTPFKSFYIDIDLMDKFSKNARIQYLKYFNKAQSDIIMENERLKQQVSELKDNANKLKLQKNELMSEIKKVKSENRELKKLIIRESSKKDILRELELFEKLSSVMKIKGFKEETYIDFYNKYWNNTQSDILDVNDMLEEKNSKITINKSKDNLRVIKFEDNKKVALDDDLELPDYDDF